MTPSRATERFQGVRAKMTSSNCQLPCLRLLAEGIAEVPPQSLRRRLKLIVRRRLPPRQERMLKKRSNNIIAWLSSLARRGKKPPTLASGSAITSFKAGDLVRVPPKEEIQATLDYWRQLKGCTFMAEMWPYCGTVPFSNLTAQVPGF